MLSSIQEVVSPYSSLWTLVLRGTWIFFQVHCPENSLHPPKNENWFFCPLQARESWVGPAHSPVPGTLLPTKSELSSLLFIRWRSKWCPPTTEKQSRNENVPCHRLPALGSSSFRSLFLCPLHTHLGPPGKLSKFSESRTHPSYKKRSQARPSYEYSARQLPFAEWIFCWHLLPFHTSSPCLDQEQLGAGAHLQFSFNPLSKNWTNIYPAFFVVPCRLRGTKGYCFTLKGTSLQGKKTSSLGQKLRKHNNTGEASRGGGGAVYLHQTLSSKGLLPAILPYNRIIYPHKIFLLCPPHT